MQKKIQAQEVEQKQDGDKKSKKKNWYDTLNSLYNKSSVGDNSPGRKHFSNNVSVSNAEIDNHSISPGKMIEEQKKKVFLHKKQQMLKNFEVPNKEKQRYMSVEAESQAIRNSLDAIGDPDPKHKVPEGKLTVFGKETESKFLQPLHNSSNLILGKKPCARDGHCSVIINDEIIIFGGDRHQMSFSDIYKLNFGVASKDISKS